MTESGMVIGLGGIGAQVIQRVKNILTSRQKRQVPENLRLLAFDVMHPAATAGRLVSPFPFLHRLTPGEVGVPATRQTSRQVMINDLKRGADSSVAWREIAANLQALRNSGAERADIFIVSSSFGLTGSAWLLDIAYVCQQSSRDGLDLSIHAVIITPEAFQNTYNLTPVSRQINYTTLKELEAFQKKTDWGEAFLLFAGPKPGLLLSAPFATVQLVDGQNLGGSPELSAIPAAAEGILCQLDEQAAHILRASLHRQHDSGDDRVFSSFGVHSLTRPAHLLVETGVQRAVLELVDNLLPLRTNPSTGSPEGLEAARILVPSDPYGDIERWLGDYPASGVLDDIMHQVGLTPVMRPDWIQRLAKRENYEWKRVLFTVAGGERYFYEKKLPESTLPFIKSHLQAYLKALAAKVLRLNGNPIGPFEYLSRFELTLNNYLADLSRAEDMLIQSGEHTRSEELRQTIELARSDLEQKRASNLSRLFPKRIDEAQLRYERILHVYEAFQQRETLVEGARKSASLMLAVTRAMIELYTYYGQALALSPDSLFNSALDRFKNVDHELQYERSVRCQQVVVDKVYEDRQVQAIMNRLLSLVFDHIHERIEGIYDTVDWQANTLVVHAPLQDPNNPAAQVDLAAMLRQPEETAALLKHLLTDRLSEQVAAALCSNTITSFTNYIHTNPVKLAADLIYLSEPLAQLLVPPTRQVTCLFLPDPEAASTLPNISEMVYEIYQRIGELYQIDNDDPDRITLFRRFDGLGLDNLMTVNRAAHGTFGPREVLNEEQLKPHRLWNF